MTSGHYRGGAMKRDEKYNRIIDSAENVFFKYGYEQASMDQVAQDADVAKGTLYLYFQSKQELYYAIGVRALEVLLKSFHTIFSACETGLDKVVAFGKAFAQYRKTYPDYYKFIINYQGERYNEMNKHGEVHRTYQESRELFKVLVDAVAEGQKDGSIRVKSSPALLAAILWCQTCGVVQLTELREAFFLLFSPFSADQMLEAYFELTEKVLSQDTALNIT
jgi:AcrR family transcriptional regulator